MYFMSSIQIGDKVVSSLIKVIDDFERISIPMTEQNSDYQEYLEWLAEGNTPELWNPEEQ